MGLKKGVVKMDSGGNGMEIKNGFEKRDSGGDGMRNI